MDNMAKEKSDKILYFDEWKFWSFLLLIFGAIYVYPYYSTEYLNYVDVPFHLNRIEGIKESLLGGEIPARVHSYQMNGYGTLDGVMYPDLLLYFPAILRILGAPLGLSWNIYWIFAVFLGLLTSFAGFTIWSQNLRKGAVAALFLQGSEMGFFALGAAAGDYPAFFALPLAIGALVKILEDEKYAKYWPFLVIGFTIIFETHIITTTLLSVLIFAILILNYKALKNKIQRVAILKSAAFSILLNIWFTAPFVYFYKTVEFHINHPKLAESLHQFSVDFEQIASEQFHLGLPIFILLILLLIFKKTRKNKAFIKSIFAYSFLVFTTHNYFPWEWIEKSIPGGSFLPNFQFAIRFVPFGLVFLIYYIGSLFCDIIKKKYLAGIAAFLICMVSIFVSFQNRFPVYFDENNVPIKDYKSAENLPSYTTEKVKVQEDYLYADIDFHKLRNEKNEVFSSNDYKTDAKLFNIKKRGTRLEFSYMAEHDTKIQVPLFYWKGYEAKDENGNGLDVYFGENRFMEVSVPKGEHRVTIRYAGLIGFRVCDAISLITLIVFCFILMRKKLPASHIRLST